MELHETQERIEHAERAHHQERKRAALLIIVLAVALAITEMAGKEAQFSSIAYNIESSDIYAFYQAKTIRATFLRTAVESADTLVPEAAERAEARQKQLAAWKGIIDRLDSDPASGEGRKELLERAKALEERRDHEEHAYHHYEFAAAGLQLAIVFASAAVITEVTLLEIISAALGVVAMGLSLLGWFAPAVLRL